MDKDVKGTILWGGLYLIVGIIILILITLKFIHDGEIKINGHGTFQGNTLDAYEYIKRGREKVEMGDYFNALTDYNQAIELNSRYADAYYYRGKAKYELKQYKAAIDDYDKAIRLNPDDASAYFHRANAKLMKKSEEDQERAQYRDNDPRFYSSFTFYFDIIKDYDEAIKHDPEFKEAYYIRGLVKSFDGQHLEAIADFDMAIRLNPKNTDAYYNRARVKHNMGFPSEAKKDFQTAVKLAEQAGNERLKAEIESAIQDRD